MLFLKVMIINPEFLRYVYEKWLKKQGKYPSTGFIMLMLALHICDEVKALIIIIQSKISSYGGVLLLLGLRNTFCSKSVNILSLNTKKFSQLT